MSDHLSINLSIGKSCFSICKGCYNHWGKGDLIEDHFILKFLDFIKENINIRKVTLCGGDPLSRPNIIEIIQKIKNRGFSIQLDTVGTPLLGETCSTIFYGTNKVAPVDPFIIASLVDMLGIPIDGVTNTQANFFRSGRPYIIDETLSILDKLSLAKANVCINTVVHKQNIKELSHVFEIVKNKKAIKKWQFFQFQGTGPLGSKNREFYEVSSVEFENFIDIMKSQSFGLPFEKNIEYKSVMGRRNNYLLIDTAGVAWMPKIEKNSNPLSNQRIIIGNITTEEDFKKILNTILKI